MSRSRQLPRQRSTIPQPWRIRDTGTGNTAGGSAEPPEPGSDRAAGGSEFVEVELLEPNPQQPRKRFDEERLRELAESLSTHGLIQPIVVSPLADGEDGRRRYQIVAGERRWRAAQLAGLAYVRVILRDSTEAERLELAVVENLQRADLDPIEEARAFEALMDLHGYSQSELAARIGKERSSVANTLRLLKLPAAVQEMVIAGELTMGHARALLGLERSEQMYELGLQALRREMSVRQVEAEVRRQSRPTKQSGRTEVERSHHDAIGDAERRLRDQLGVRARVRPCNTKPGGSIELPFRDIDELQRIIELLGLPPRFKSRRSSPAGGSTDRERS